jgi:hypothetical protein
MWICEPCTTEHTTLCTIPLPQPRYSSPIPSSPIPIPTIIFQKQNKKRRHRKTRVWKDVNFVRFPKELHTSAKVNTSSSPVTKTSRYIIMISSDEQDFFKPTTKTKSTPKATNETQIANTLANPKTHFI